MYGEQISKACFKTTVPFFVITFGEMTMNLESFDHMLPVDFEVQYDMSGYNIHDCK